MMRYIAKPANLFTGASLFCGLYSVMVSAGADPADSEAFFIAALLIIYAGIFDGLDGRVARMTHTESDFGIQMDSLVDVVSFGVAPGVLLYKWGLEAYGQAGFLVAFLFTLCGVFRLARFNLTAQEDAPQTSHRYTQGLTITAAGGMVAVLVLHHAKIRAVEVDSNISVLLLTLMLSYLMISTVRFRTFREIRVSPLTISLLALIAASGVIVLVRYDITLLLVLIGGTYIGSGLLEEALYFAKKRRATDVYYLEDDIRVSKLDDELKEEDEVLA